MAAAGQIAARFCGLITMDEAIRRAREAWQNRGQHRPPFAQKPGPGQESVWDYPRPPRLMREERRVMVKLGEVTIAVTERAIKVMETASAPTFYLPPDEVNSGLLHAAEGQSLCEWKGTAQYWDVVLPDQQLSRTAWSYPEPYPEFRQIRDYLAFYPHELECYLSEERVRPQPGGFYGGWVSDDIVGPFKGAAGTGSW